MGLSDTAIKHARSAEKPFKLTDGKGLFLLVAPSGGKLWRWKYRFEGKEKLMPLGAYPDVSLADATRRLAPCWRRAPIRWSSARRRKRPLLKRART
jgi:hypothetical protein